MQDMKHDIQLDEELLIRLPKVALHEHLDGCLRPATILDLAKQIGYEELPESDPILLGDWFARGANRGSLGEYLEGFAHTIAVMQTASALERVAYEFLEDQKNDGVVYAEVRFAPHFHTGGELGLDAVMRSVLDGLNRASKEHDVGFGLIVCAMRNGAPEFSEDMAELAVSYRTAGCVGFDLAGEETGNPAKVHVDAFQLVKRQNFNITIHAGESFGPASIWQALQFCGAHRIGHGTRIIEDIVMHEGKVIQVGNLAQYIIDHRIPLEICLSSNVHTGAAASLAEHPFPVLHKLGFRLTLNTDNRLMSATTMTKEYAIAVKHYGLSFDDLETISLNSMKSAFATYDTRCSFIFDRIKKPFREIRKELGLEPRQPYGSAQ